MNSSSINVKSYNLETSTDDGSWTVNIQCVDTNNWLPGHCMDFRSYWFIIVRLTWLANLQCFFHTQIFYYNPLQPKSTVDAPITKNLF